MKSIITKILVSAFFFNHLAWATPADKTQLAEEVFKTTYIAFMKKQDPLKVNQDLAKRLEKSGLTVQDVLDAAVRQEWVSKKEADAVIQTTKKYASNREFVEKLRTKGVSVQDIQLMAKAFQGQVTGAQCGRCILNDEFRLILFSPFIFLIASMALIGVIGVIVSI